ncbi:hypothetical protein RFI_27322 [Reticulomyxa filosa]|uniref:XLF-like N-terminal domain-containing protein n=1 Tax=Reticulomyxa filosa TaxID=46433 RepID=X6MAJ1_RETFI|nr:hypothetical protein RFI_27322 [Reticulomyxa filosa]|eukprot:ETO10055.1 hypothetical protein RFI_27322 [Reticulomyxa filosa]
MDSTDALSLDDSVLNEHHGSIEIPLELKSIPWEPLYCDEVKGVKASEKKANENEEKKGESYQIKCDFNENGYSLLMTDLVHVWYSHESGQEMQMKHKLLNRNIKFQSVRHINHQLYKMVSSDIVSAKDHFKSITFSGSNYSLLLSYATSSNINFILSFFLIVILQKKKKKNRKLKCSMIIQIVPFEWFFEFVSIGTQEEQAILLKEQFILPLMRMTNELACRLDPELRKNVECESKSNNAAINNNNNNNNGNKHRGNENKIAPTMRMNLKMTSAQLYKQTMEDLSSEYRYQQQSQSQSQPQPQLQQQQQHHHQQQQQQQQPRRNANVENVTESNFVNPWNANVESTSDQNKERKKDKPKSKPVIESQQSPELSSPKHVFDVSLAHRTLSTNDRYSLSTTPSKRPNSLNPMFNTQHIAIVLYIYFKKKKKSEESPTIPSSKQQKLNNGQRMQKRVTFKSGLIDRNDSDIVDNNYINANTNLNINVNTTANKNTNTNKNENKVMEKSKEKKSVEQVLENENVIDVVISDVQKNKQSANNTFKTVAPAPVPVPTFAAPNANVDNAVDDDVETEEELNRRREQLEKLQQKSKKKKTTKKLKI